MVGSYTILWTAINVFLQNEMILRYENSKQWTTMEFNKKSSIQ